MYNDCVVENGGNHLVPPDSYCYDVWLSVKSTVDKSTVDNPGSIIIYSYEDHECVSAKVVLHTSHISSGLSSQHQVVADWSCLEDLCVTFDLKAEDETEEMNC